MLLEKDFSQFSCTHKKEHQVMQNAKVVFNLKRDTLGNVAADCLYSDYHPLALFWLVGGGGQIPLEHFFK